MISRAVLSVFLAITFFSLGFGQKIKYKDLFILLNAKQYSDAEPFLKKYLRDNDDNPNAYLFMGIIYQEKSAKLDALKQTEMLVSQMDSAVYYFDKAMKTITEKELNRNDEYYQMYTRRDLRTGKFGITLSDVQLDLEERIKKKERSKQILALKSQFTAAERYYIRASQIFKEIQNAYADQKQFYLRADEKLLAQLRHLAQVYDSCHITFNDYKATSQALGKTGYNQDLDPEDIKDFKKDGTTPADFYRDDLKVWDFKRWALSSLETIETEINPLKEQLIARDIEINKLHQKLRKDSVTVRQEVVALQTKGFPGLLKIDAQPLPLKVFEMKEAELYYGSQIAEDRPLKDSLSISLQVAAIKKELTLAKKMDSLSEVLAGRNLEEEAENYKHFVTTAYGTPAVLKSLVKSTKEYAVREVNRKENELKRKIESLRWIADGADSIPLFNEVLAIGRFKPLILVEDKYTAGMQYVDSVAKGYFYLISPSRKPTVKAMYPVDQQAFKKRNIPVTKALSTQDENGLVYFVVSYLETKINDNYPATITKIYKAEGLGWSIDYAFDQLPTELVFSIEASELSVKTKSSIGEIFVIVFDKNGKVLKQ